MAKLKRGVMYIRKERDVLKPLFYDQFSCKGGTCRNTCCAGWAVFVNKQNYHLLKALHTTPELQQKIKEKVKRNNKAQGESDYAHMVMGKDGNCPFLNKDKLCDLIISEGDKTLCNTCKYYPRNAIQVGSILYPVMSPSCEEVVKHLLELPQGLDFTIEKEQEKDIFVGASGVEADMEHIFHHVFTLTVDILQNRSYPLGERMLLLGLAMDNLVLEYKKTNFTITNWTEKYQVFAQGNDHKGLADAMPKDSEKAIFWNINSLVNMYNASKMTINDGTTNMIRTALERIESSLEVKELTFSRSAMQEKLNQYQNYFSDKEYFWENLLITTWLMLVHNRQPLEQLFAQLCVYYSICRFILAITATGDYTQEYIEDIVAKVSRSLLHGTAIANLHVLMKAFDGTTVPKLAFLVL